MGLVTIVLLFVSLELEGAIEVIHKLCNPKRGGGEGVLLCVTLGHKVYVNG